MEVVMASIEEKIQKFSAFVLDDAQKQRDEMINSLEKEKKERIDNKEFELLSNAYSDIQVSLAKTKRENNERILKHEMELKKQLILERETMIHNIFTDVMNKITDFIGSTEYKEWLIEKVKTAAQEVGLGEKVVTVTNSDFRYKPQIEALSTDMEVIGAEDDALIGGVKMFNRTKQIAVDYSILSLLEQEHEDFLQKSGLSIE